MYPFSLLCSLKCGTIVMDSYVISCTILIQIMFGWSALYLIKRPSALSPQTEHCFLSDGPDKAGSNFFRYEAIRFPQIGMFLFLHEEYMKLQKGSLRNKMYQNPLWKGISFCLKILTNHKSCKQHPTKVYVLRNSHRISVISGVRRDFVIRRLSGKLRINLDVALWGFQTKCCLTHSPLNRP